MSVDIVNLIESNPITKFTGNYQSKLIEKVKNTFTEYEQQIFLTSFYCYLKYDYKNDFVIELDNVWKWLGFQQKYHAKYLLEKQFIINNHYKIFAPEASGAKKNIRGGHNKEVIMLNIDTFKKFCLKAGTKKADEIHDYFIKLEEILQEILFEESNELKLQLEQLENTKNKELEEKLIKQKIIEREKILLKEYSQSGPIVYIIKVKSLENGQYIVKIGHSSKGIQNRYTEHKSKYEECLLLDCFSVDKSKDFESFLHNHESIRLNRVHNLQGHENENELFLVGNNLTYQMILKLIDSNIKNYNYSVNELLRENEILQIKLQSNQNNINNELLSELLKTINLLSKKVDNLEKTNQEILSKFNSQQTKVSTGFSEPLVTLGPRLQKIQPESLQLVKVYESVTEAMKENSNIKRPSINKAIVENTIYCGFRWLLVDRNLDPNVIHNIIPTKLTKTQSLGYIAQLNSEKTEITNVYLDRKTAAHFNGYESSSALDNPVKNFTFTKGHYYKLYDDCDSQLREYFEEKNGEILLYKNGVGQFDLENNLICEFACKYDCIKSLSMSDKTLAKALNNNIAYNGFYFKEIGSKLKINN
jgi:phage anti-repressor protein